MNNNEEIKKQDIAYGPELKSFTNTKSSSIIKGAEALNKKLNINSGEQSLNQYANDYKPNYREMAVNLKEKVSNDNNDIKTPRFTIPNEKKEQDRLRKIIDTYDLKKVEPSELQKHIKLKEKTPDDYYSYKLPHQELNKRLDKEAFGPKTDFSIWNFENNFDKLNNEEQSMMTYKMQREFNNLGYTDADGKELKTDGIFGNKTRSAYNKYIKANKVDFEDYNNFKVKENFDNNNIKTQETDNKKPEIKENVDYWVLKDSKGNPLYLASADMDLTGVVSTSGKTSEKSPDVYYKPTTSEFDQEYWKNNIEDKIASNQEQEPIKEKFRLFITKLATHIIGTENLATKVTDPFSHYLRKHAQRVIWKTGAEEFLRKQYKCEVSAWMLEHSLKDKPEKVVRGNDSTIAYKINNSKEYLEALDKAITNSKDGVIDQPIEVAPFSDTDLYLSINKAKVYVKGYKDKDGIWNIQTTLKDTYDFTEILFFEKGMSGLKTLGTLANNAAFVSQLTEAITPFKVEVNFYTRREEK